VLQDLAGAPDSPSGVLTSAQWQAWILDSLWISDSRVDEFGAGGTLITDDRPYTEYNLLRQLLKRSSPAVTREELLGVMPKSVP
jgi:hypothetical protein